MTTNDAAEFDPNERIRSWSEGVLNDLMDMYLRHELTWHEYEDRVHAHMDAEREQINRRLTPLLTEAVLLAGLDAAAFTTQYADAEVRGADGKLLAVVTAGEHQARMLSALRSGASK